MPSPGLVTFSGHWVLRPTRRGLNWPHRFWRKGSNSELGALELSPAFFGRKEDAAFWRSLSRREWFGGTVLHSPRLGVCPPPGGHVLPSTQAFKSSVMFPGVSPALPGKGVEDDPLRAPGGDGDRRSAKRLHAARPHADWSCSPMAAWFWARWTSKHYSSKSDNDSQPWGHYYESGNVHSCIWSSNTHVKEATLTSNVKSRHRGERSWPRRHNLWVAEPGHAPPEVGLLTTWL